MRIFGGARRFSAAPDTALSLHRKANGPEPAPETGHESPEQGAGLRPVRRRGGQGHRSPDAGGLACGGRRALQDGHPCGNDPEKDQKIPHRERLPHHPARHRGLPDRRRNDLIAPGFTENPYIGGEGFWPGANLSPYSALQV